MADIAKIKKNNKTPGYEPALLHLWPRHYASLTTTRYLDTCLSLIQTKNIYFAIKIYTG